MLALSNELRLFGVRIFRIVDDFPRSPAVAVCVGADFDFAPLLREVSTKGLLTEKNPLETAGSVFLPIVDFTRGVRGESDRRIYITVVVGGALTDAVRNADEPAAALEDQRVAEDLLCQVQEARAVARSVACKRVVPIRRIGSFCVD